MKYVWLIAIHEYVENAKTKGFWIGMFMLPLIIFGSIKITVLLQTKSTPVRNYLVVDQSGMFGSALETRMKQWSGGAEKRFQAAAWPEGIDTNGPLSSIVQGLKPYLRRQKQVEAGGRKAELYAAILIPRDIEEQIAGSGRVGANGIEYWSVNLADTSLRDAVEQAVNTEIRRRQYLAHGMDLAVLQKIEKTRAPFTSLNPDKEAGSEAVSQADIIRQWAPSGFVYLLWIAIFTISQMLLNNVIEEKSNRIIEVLLSSVTPGELMMGKLAGIACLGLTMVGTWVAALFAALLWKSGATPEVADHILVVLRTSNLVPMFAVYFLLGYLMYAAFILTLGSVCNTIKEAQNYMGMITMLMMVPMLTMTFIPKDPNGTIARVLSWIPVYTPFIMLNRVNASPPLVDSIGTSALLLATAALALWMAGKIFRIGILRTGQPPRIMELLRWIKG